MRLVPSNLTHTDEEDGKTVSRFRGGSWLAGSKDGDWKCLRASYRATAAEVSPLEAGFRVVLAKAYTTREPTLAECARDGLLEKAAALLAKGAAVDEAGADGRTPLHLAGAGGHLALVNALIKAGAKLEKTDDTGSTPLHAAALAGSLPVVEALVAAGAKVRARVRLTGSEPIHQAVRHPEILAFLFEHGADLRTRDNFGNTPLHMAAVAAAHESVSWLAEQKVPLDAREADGITPLASAAIAGDPETCALLIRLGACTNPPAADNGITLLAMAAMRANPEVVELLLQHGADPKPVMVSQFVTMDIATFQLKQQRRDGASALGKMPLLLQPAAPGDRAKVIRMLVEAGMPLEQTTSRGMTPLLNAAYEGNTEAVQTLLELGAKADAADNERYTALHSASEQGFVKVVELLLGKGLDLEAVHNRGRTALDCAALMGHSEIVRRLLDAGAKPDGAPDAPSTPADTAARQGNAAILELLLARGADPNAVGKGGVTPLMGAACGPWFPAGYKVIPLSENSKVPHGTAADYLFCVKLLLEKGADPLATADDGSTALHQAALCNQADAARLLLEAKVPVNALNKHLLTPLHSAAHGNAVDAAKVLLEHGATAAPDLASYTPLHAAAAAGALEMVALLLEHGANPNQRDGQQSTPLHRAVIAGNLPLVKLLIARGADLGSRDFGYATPLHQAVIADKPEIVRALMAAGADPSLRNMEGMTPGDMAKLMRRDSCAAALSRAKIPADQAEALGEYLKRHPDWRQLQEKDCDPANLKFARDSFGAAFSPYYYEEDFNSDGRNDFAVVLANKAPPVEDKDLADSHKWRYQLRVVVFNGLPGGGYDAVFAEDDQGPLACFLNKWEEPNSKLYFGVLETCQGFVIVPTERGYRFEAVREPE
ncbi:MAG: ankyrin repeat domain-containing protein [Akkermansiaceae bacterium]|nr:ankyrin repeat domain-containing protein [Akkermansiaceae bacterium]